MNKYDGDVIAYVSKQYGNYISWVSISGARHQAQEQICKKDTWQIKYHRFRTYVITQKKLSHVCPYDASPDMSYFTFLRICFLNWYVIPLHTRPPVRRHWFHLPTLVPPPPPAQHWFRPPARPALVAYLGVFTLVCCIGCIFMLHLWFVCIGLIFRLHI